MAREFRKKGSEWGSNLIITEGMYLTGVDGYVISPRISGKTMKSLKNSDLTMDIK